MRRLVLCAWIWVALVGLVACTSDKKEGDVTSQDVSRALKFADIRIGKEEAPPHQSGPDDSGLGGLSPKAEPPAVAESPEPEEMDVDLDNKDPNVGLSEESLKTLSTGVAAIFRKPNVLTDDAAKVSFAYQFEEGRTLRSRLHSRVTTRTEGAASSMTFDMTWSELYGAMKRDMVPVKWSLQDVKFAASGASEEYVQVLERALSKLSFTYETSTVGSVQNVEMQGEVAPEFAPLAEALVAGFRQAMVELPKEPRGIGGTWTGKSSFSASGATTGTRVKYSYRGRVKGPKGQDWAYIDFTLGVDVKPDKGSKGPKGKGLGRGAFLFDLSKGIDVAILMRLDLQEEFSGPSGEKDDKQRQTIAMELVSERLF